MKKIFLFILITLFSCGIPSPESVRTLNTPSIIVGNKIYIDGTYYRYTLVQKLPSESPPTIRIRIQAYQPEIDFSGFNIYINNSNETQTGLDDGTKASIQAAHLNHYYFDRTSGTYSKQQTIENWFIISQNKSSALFPSIPVSELSSISTVVPPIVPVFPAIQNYPVTFEIDIKWDGMKYFGRDNSLKTDGRVYNIAITAVDIAGKNESKLSNIIKVRFTGNPLDGDPDHDL